MMGRGELLEYILLSRWEGTGLRHQVKGLALDRSIDEFLFRKR